MSVAKERVDPQVVSAFATFSGSAKEIEAEMSRLHGERVVAVSFKSVSASFDKAFVDTLSAIGPLVNTIIERRQHEALESILNALVPSSPPPSHLVFEANMKAKARAAVLLEPCWLSAAKISEMAGFSRSNKSAQPNKWKKEGLIFAINHRGNDYYPEYGLNSEDNYRPIKAMAQVIEIFGDTKDAWGMAYWFASVNSFLGGRRPRDLLESQPGRVIGAAKDEVSEVCEIAHG
jgi:hypothetical protein